MAKNGWQSKTLTVTRLHLDAKNPPLGCETPSPAPREIIQYPFTHQKPFDVALSLVARRFPMKASLAAAVLLVALIVPSAYAQYIYVANTGEDTVSKIDINTNQEVARYSTWFTSGTNYVAQPHNYNVGPAPSRLMQDSAGYLYVLNRFFSPLHRPVLLKIAPFGGIPGITTSNGPLSVLSITDVDGDNHIDPGDAKDVRILWANEIGTSADDGALGRALCMDTSGVLWVGIHNTQRYYRVDPATGNVIGSAIPTTGHKPYGCQVDTKGKLWSVDSSNTLAEIDTVTNQLITIHPQPFGINYSISLFNGCGTAPSKIYVSEWSSVAPRTYMAFDPQTPSWTSAPLLTTEQFASLSVGVDLNGNIVSGQRVGGRIIKTTPTGTVLWDTNTLPAGPVVEPGLLPPHLPPQDLHGIIIDAHNDVWAVHLFEDRVVKYSGVDGHRIKTLPVGKLPYTYGNPPPPTCPCAEILEPRISCEKQSNDTATYSWSFTYTNRSPILTPATAIDISSSQVTNLTPALFQFTNPVPPNGQATVSGTFTVANPVPGSQVCLDIRMNAGEGGCCPVEHVCFTLPECPGCAKLKAAFKCQNGTPVLQLAVTNQGPTAASSVQVYSNTPGVTVTPQMTTQAFPQNTQVNIPLLVTGAAPGQAISLTVNLNGPFDPKTGVNDWCCTSTVTVSYPKLGCPTQLSGWIFNDLDLDGLRDSAENGLSAWNVTLTDGKGTPRTTTSVVSGMYAFEDVEPGTYRLSVQLPRGWRATVPEAGVHTVTVVRQPDRTFDFGFVKTQP